MKKIIILALALWVAISVAADVVIGTGMETSNFPFNDYYAHSISQYLYLASEIGVPAGGTITHLKWFRDDVGANPNAIGSTQIWLNETILDNISIWQNEGTKVAEIDDIDLGSGGDWFTIDIDDYQYNGGHLLVTVRTQNAIVMAPHALWRCTLVNSGCKVQQGNSSTNNPPNTTNSNLRPNITLVGITDTRPPGACMIVSPRHGDQDVAIDAQLSWLPGSGMPTGYDIYFGESLPVEGDPAVSHSQQSTTSWSPGTLEYSSTYYWKIVPHNPYGSANFNSCPTWSFTTQEDPVQPLPYGQDFDSCTMLSTFNWDGDMLIMPAHGTDGSHALSASLWYNYYSSFATSPPLGPLQDESQIVFDYRYVDYYDYPQDATFLDVDDKLEIQVAFNGSQQFETIHTINRTNHIPSASFATCIIPLNGYAGEVVTIRFAAYCGWGDYYLDIDNFLVQEAPFNPVFYNSPNSLDFGTVHQDTPTGWQEVSVTNVGSGALILSPGDVSIIGSDAAMFDVDATKLPASLTSGQSVILPVRFTAMDEGDFSAILRIVFESVNHDIALSGSGLPIGTVVIGTGNSGQRQPFGHYWGYERSATIYPSSHIGLQGVLEAVAWKVLQPSSLPIPYKIYAGTTSANSFTPQTWDSLKATLTLVKEGSHTFSEAGWNTFGFDTSIAISGDNLILAVETDFGNSGSSPYAMFASTNGGSNIHQHWNQDHAPPEGNGNLNSQYPNVMLQFAQNVDLAITGFRGDSMGLANSPLSLAVTVTNTGATSISSYTVKLLNHDGNEVLEQLLVTDPLAPGQSAIHQIVWIPLIEGEYQVFSRVDLPINMDLQHNISELLAIKVFRETMDILHVGDPQSSSTHTAFPFNFSYKDFVAETIYLASEIQASAGNIQALVYINHFADGDAAEDFQIWMKNTDVANLSNGWLSAQGYTLVYEGPIYGAAGTNLVAIPITPFPYTGSNLGIRTRRVTAGARHQEKYWHTTIDENYPYRSRYYQTDTPGFDHSNPPLGTVANHIPNIAFLMDDAALITHIPPPTIQITKHNGKISLSWLPVPYAYSYRIYKSDNPHYFAEECDDIIYENSYQIKPQDGDAAAFYRVSAVMYRAGGILPQGLGDREQGLR
ncbi:MAG: choice-of-anchor D domain-containing protein [Candidatus Cloacimonetes bacterium]|nr:choice-of-anchor D domain-containing protein [Candidatus Cloacimonadota bacterium]